MRGKRAAERRRAQARPSLETQENLIYIVIRINYNVDVIGRQRGLWTDWVMNVCFVRGAAFAIHSTLKCGVLHLRAKRARFFFSASLRSADLLKCKILGIHGGN